MRKRLFSQQIFPRKIKKLALSISHHKGILSKHVNACFSTNGFVKGNVNRFTWTNASHKIFVNSPRSYDITTKFAHIISCTLLCILKGYLLFWSIFRSYIVSNICWLQKQVFWENEPQPWLLEFSATQTLTESRAAQYP